MREGIVMPRRLSERFCQAIRKHWQLYVLLIIPVVYIIIFAYIPMYGAQIAFKKFNIKQGIWGSPWIGIDNFIRLFRYPKFSNLISNTLILSFYSLFAGFPFPIILALALNCIRDGKFKKSVQMMSYLPNFISLVVVVGMLFQFFNPRIGFIGKIISLIYGQPTDIFLKGTSFRHIMVWSGIWQGMGFGSIIYISVLSSVSPELHEAAIIDGATRWKRVIHIDFPAIIPTSVIMLILSTGGILSSGFEKILLLQNGANLPYSEVLDTYVYKVGLTASVPDQSYATAVGLFKSIVGFILLVTVNRISATFSENSLW
jgi:putative aldouronate transport system permease protein